MREAPSPGSSSGKSWAKPLGSSATGPPLRDDFRQTGAGGELVFGNRLGFVNSNRTGVGLNKAFVEDPAGKLVEVFFLDGEQEAGADLGGQGDLLERDLALLPFPL